MASPFPKLDNNTYQQIQLPRPLDPSTLYSHLTPTASKWWHTKLGYCRETARRFNMLLIINICWWKRYLCISINLAPSMNIRTTRGIMTFDVREHYQLKFRTQLIHLKCKKVAAVDVLLCEY